MKISVITKDKYLVTQAELILAGRATVSLDPDPEADITLLDVDTAAKATAQGKRIIRLSRIRGMADETIPLSFDFYNSLTDGCRAGIALSDEDRTCTVDGRLVKLTSLEFSLLSLLVSKKGEYASREQISEVIFGGGGDNMINLYIHYLREKLENGSERIIISSRKQGYAINKEFLGGKVC